MRRIGRSRPALRLPATVFAAALVALGPPGAGALAQLPPVPAPKPVEQVVQESPAAPVYNGARETVEGLTGGGSQGGGNGGGGAGAGSGEGSGDGGSGQGTGGEGPGRSTPADPGSSTPTGGRPPSPRAPAARSSDGRGRAGAGRRRADAGPRRRAGERARGDGARERARRVAHAQDEEGGGAGPIGDIAEVIPAPVLVALGLLAALALALNMRTGLERRRTRWLEREREQLLLDVGVLQRALLPPVPERLGALSASVAYSPADGPGAGGDFYDAFALPDDRVGVIVGDVAGHGRQALAKTASVRHTLAAYLRGGLSPRAALGTVGALLSDADDNVFTTVVLAVHDRAAGRLTYAAAGHPPPIFRGPAGHEPVTVASSPPLGAGVPTGLRQTTVALPAGSVVCLFTDGLLEAKTGEGLLGRERLTAMVAELPPDAPAGALLEAVAREADETPDDMAACVLRALEGPEGPGHRVEELELWGDLAELATAERFLEACGVGGDDLATALTSAGDALTAFGTALLRVTDTAGTPEVAVTPRAGGPASSREPPFSAAAAL
jgi:hypothetical protein